MTDTSAASAPNPSLSHAQVRLLAFAHFVQPLSNGEVECGLQTGLHGSALTAVRSALSRRGLLDQEGSITGAGIAALNQR